MTQVPDTRRTMLKFRRFSRSKGVVTRDGTGDRDFKVVVPARKMT